MDPKFFASAAAWRKWLERHHALENELLVGFYKRGSGRANMTWPESVDEALCFGWIDGVRRSIDDESYSIRFTPRRPRSIWSSVNTKRVAELTSLGRMHEAGLRAFAARSEERSGVYSFERENVRLTAAQEEQFRSDAQAWRFFSNQPPWYRHAAAWWVVSAKREETRTRRLALLIADSAQGRSIASLSRPVPKKRLPR